MDEVVITNINMDTFIPLGIKPAEVIANALRESGLITNYTQINGMNPIELCTTFIEKKSNYQQLTKLGNLLVKNKVITLQQLKDALATQNANPSMKLGNILISMGACSKFDIERCIKSQDKIREDIKKLDDYEDKVDLLRKRLSGGKISNDHI
ncbi:MAG: hypothetical protein A2Y25_02980 [Candidatus Melainabacteria bacterium GWF2_37_15]|nr:MAG: hypothetical protein A2Y25_02980 [Candidatus Melainabacteria bacterium GWF2_37_15]